MKSHYRKTNVAAPFVKQAFCDDPAYLIQGLRERGLLLIGGEYAIVVRDAICKALCFWRWNEYGDLEIEQPSHQCDNPVNESPSVQRIAWYPWGAFGNSINLIHRN